MKYYILLLYFLFNMSMTLRGQVDIKRILPPNPNVASLMKATLTPVTEYAGLPNISIPLYTIKEGNIIIPISISYHAGGIQVGEESGSVGLGWALNAGGVISRSINGYGDYGEGSIGSGYSAIGSTPDPVISNEDDLEYFNPVSNPYVTANSNCEFIINGTATPFSIDEVLFERELFDYIPDTYYFNFNGFSGSFLIKQDGSIFLSDKSNLKITGNGRNEFKIITQEGVTYEFNKFGSTLTNISDSMFPVFSYVSSWYLTKINSTNGDKVDFIYDNKGYSYPIKSFTQLYLTGVTGTGGYTGFKNIVGPQAKIDDVYLTEIIFSNGKIKFNYSDQNERQDISTAYFLKNIEIFNNQGLIKNYTLEYSYFGSSVIDILQTYEGGYGGLTWNNSNPHPNLRLRLDRLVENNNEKTHSFEYFDSQNLIPNKTSMSQDYWGFYNGITNLTSFIPYVDGQYGDIPIKAKRYPVEEKAKLFSLKKIIYPTKGFTEFDYELNTYDHTFEHIPISNLPPSVPTSERTERATTFGGGVWVVKEIHPTLNTEIRFNLAIYGSNLSDNPNDPIPNRYEHPFKFESDMIARVREISSQNIVWQRSFVPSEQAYIDFNNTGQAFFSEIMELPNPVNGGYTLEVYFKNDFGGAQYFGMAQAVASWQETDQGDFEKYSSGGGLRIKSITDSDIAGQLRKRNYNYHYKELVNGIEVEKSYGEIKTMPNFSSDDRQNGPVLGDGSLFSLQVGEASSHNTLSKQMGSYVGYSQVEVTFEDELGTNNGKTISKFYNYEDYYIFGNINAERKIEYKFPPISLPYNGFLYKQETYKRDDNSNESYTLVREIENSYLMNNNTLISENGSVNVAFTNFFKSVGSDFVMSGIIEKLPTILNSNPCLDMTFFFYPNYSTLVQKSFQKETVFDTNGENPIITTTNYFYDNDQHLQLTRTETTDSKGNQIKTKTDYPQDIQTPTAAIDSLISQHRIAIPIQTETTVIDVSGNELSKSTQRTNFKDWGQNGSGTTGNIILPETIQTSKGTDNPEDRIIYHDYDNKGNPLEVSKTDGTHIYYIWGYQQTQPIAKLENFTATNASNIQNLIDAAVTASNADTDTTQDNTGAEGALRTALKALREAATNSQVTTYTYDPLIGVTSITDPRGYTIYYEYDDFNRLKMVKDAEGNIVNKNEYHYKN